MKLNKNQRQIMRGLLTGNKHMSATEAADTDVHELIGEHFVHIWSTMGGFAGTWDGRLRSRSRKPSRRPRRGSGPARSREPALIVLPFSPIGRGVPR